MLPDVLQLNGERDSTCHRSSLASVGPGQYTLAWPAFPDGRITTCLAREAPVARDFAGALGIPSDYSAGVLDGQ
jgi:hypothetical protein